MAKEFDDDILNDIDLFEDDEDLFLLDTEDGEFFAPQQSGGKISQPVSTSRQEEEDAPRSAPRKGSGGKVVVIVLLVLVVLIGAALALMQFTGGEPLKFLNKDVTAETTTPVETMAVESTEPSVTVEEPVTTETVEETEPVETETAVWSGEGLAIAQITATAGSSDMVEVDNMGNQQAGGSHQVASTMASDLKAFITAARAEGYGTMLSTCYREDVTEADELDVQEHATGFAVDIVDVDAQLKVVFAQECPEEIAWLAENAAEYGFILRFPEGKEELTGMEYTPYHFVYVGKTIAAEMAEKDLCLEEYLAQ